jgi:acetyltransferase-like isoleucine patch superfamily enzyme
VNQGVTIYARERVEIGDNALLGDFVCIYDTNFHEVEEGAGVLTSPVTIGRNVWLARGAVVLPGVTIGDNCVIGANAVVSSSIPSNSLVAGNPARVLRTLRFSDGYTRAGLT